MIKNSILKRNAMAQMEGGIFTKTYIMVLAAQVIVSLINGFASSFVVGALIVSGPLVYGLCRIYVDLVKGKKEVDLADLFKGFTENFIEAFLLGLLTGLFTFLWSLLFIVPGIVKSYSYSMGTFILQDDPDKDWQTCIEESKKMMKGHKWQLFCLDLSFIGWYIVGFLCFFVGVLFVSPYHQMSRANFYMALKAMNEPDVTVEDDQSTDPNATAFTQF